MFKNKTIAVVGGTGSFGNAVTKRLLKLNPKKIIVFSRDELKQEVMRNTYLDKRLHFVIGDVRDYSSIDKAMQGVDYVFHAAALKQVPASEIYPLEYIKTNILGSNNVLESAIRNKVKKLVFLTTDKAVYPINVMGMTKALMEKVMFSGKSKTIVCGVRYGNVLSSRGSVVPYFLSLIKKSKPLLITDLAMTRFLLTLDEAVDLVLKALKSGRQGKVYVKRSPATTIETLAKAMCEIFNHKKGYKVIGKKPGEKIHETLIADELTSENTRQLNIEEVKKLLLTLPDIKEVLNETNR